MGKISEGRWQRSVAGLLIVTTGVIVLLAVCLSDNQKQTPVQSYGTENRTVPIKQSSRISAGKLKQYAGVVDDDWETGNSIQIAGNLAAQLEAVCNVGDCKEWPGLLHAVMKDLDLQGIEEVLALSRNGHLPVLFSKMMQIAVHDRWLDLDPAMAIRSADQGGVPEENAAGWLDLSLRLWAAKSPNEVFAFLRSGSLACLNVEKCYSAVARGAAGKGSREAVERALGQIRNPEVRSFSIRQIAAGWAQSQDKSFVDRWIAALPEKERPQAVAEVSVMLAAADPEAALIRLEKLKMADTELFYRTTPRVMAKWAKTDPASAADWFAFQRFNPEQADKILPVLLRVWLLKDKNAPAAWLVDCQNKGLLSEAVIRRAVEKI